VLGDLSRLLRPAVNVAHRVDAVGAYTSFPSARMTRLSSALGASRAGAFRRFGVTHVPLPIPHDVLDRGAAAAAIEGGRLVQRDEEAGFELWAVPHRPWAFFAEEAIPVPSREAALDLLLALMARGADGVVVVETRLALPTSPGRVVRVERGTESVVVEAESEGPALLVVQDAAWPGWRARVDGRPAPILVADGLVRAVAWPAGRHRLELVYDPPEVRTGLLLSALGAAALGLLVALAARRRAPPPGGYPASRPARSRAGAPARLLPPVLTRPAGSTGAPRASPAPARRRGRRPPGGC
jgi:hypothetical protein